jgi:hypothetical protein
MLNEGKSVADIYSMLAKVPRFKKLLPKDTPKAGFKVPEPILGKRKEPKNSSLATLSQQASPEPLDKAANPTENIARQVEEEKGDSILGQQTQKRQAKIQTTVQEPEQITKRGDLRSFGKFSLIKRKYIPEVGQEHLPELELTAELSNEAMNEIREAKEALGPSDSISQIGGESSAAGSLAALRKRESKAATKSSAALSSIAGSEVSNRSENGRF